MELSYSDIWLYLNHCHLRNCQHLLSTEQRYKRYTFCGSRYLTHQYSPKSLRTECASTCLINPISTEGCQKKIMEFVRATHLLQAASSLSVGFCFLKHAALQTWTHDLVVLYVREDPMLGPLNGLVFVLFWLDFFFFKIIIFIFVETEMGRDYECMKFSSTSGFVCKWNSFWLCFLLACNEQQQIA